MRKQIGIITLVCLILVFSLSGCVKVVQIGHEDEITGNVKFSAAENVESIWASQAIPELEKKAVDLPKFLTESKGDLKSLAKQYGRYSMGDKGELCYVVKGQGRVVEVNREKKASYMTVKLDGYEGPQSIQLQIGSVYKGSAVRDSLSFIKYEDYKNQVDWAKISQSIHDIINKNVIGVQDLGTVQGKTISFVGCFNVDKADELLITPVELTVK
jgi:predicted lipoprotein